MAGINFGAIGTALGGFFDGYDKAKQRGQRDQLYQQEQQDRQRKERSDKLFFDQVRLPGGSGLQSPGGGSAPGQAAFGGGGVAAQAPAASWDSSPGGNGLAPGFSRGADGGLTRNGQPPDTYIGGMLPGGGAVPAWEDAPMRPYSPAPQGSGFSSGLQRLTQMGVRPEVAQGAIDYMAKNESGQNPLAINPTSGAMGRAQWLGPRKAALTHQYGEKPSDDQQAEFMGSELQGPERRTLDNLKTAQTGKEGYDIWGRDYERPGQAALKKAGVGAGGGQSGIPANDPLRQQAQQTGRSAMQGVDPSVYGRMSIEAIARRIDQAAPNEDPVVKMMALEATAKLLAPDQRERWEMFKQQNEQAFRRELQDRTDQRATERDDRHDSRQFAHERFLAGQAGNKAEGQGWDVLTDPSTNQQYRYQKSTGTAKALTSDEPYQPGGAQRLGGAGGKSASVGREGDIETEIKRLDAEFAEKTPNATKAQKDKAHFDNRKTAEAQITGATTKAGRTPSTMFMRKWAEEHPEATAEDYSRAAAGYTRDQSIERNFAGGSGATQMRSLNTVADHLKLMREYEAELASGSIPRLNQFLQRAAAEMGRPEITNAEVARDIMADEVVRLLTSTGGTEADRQGMQNRFRLWGSGAQQSGALEAAEKFVAGRFKGLQQNYARNDQGRRKEFVEEMLTPEAREMFGKYGSTGAGPGGAQQPEEINPADGKPWVYRDGKWQPKN